MSKFARLPGPDDFFPTPAEKQVMRNLGEFHERSGEGAFVYGLPMEQQREFFENKLRQDVATEQQNSARKVAETRALAV